MAKPRDTHTKETASKPAGKPKAKLGKDGPLTDTIEWKKPFEAWIKGKSNDLRGPIRESIGTMSPLQICEAILFLTEEVVHGHGSKEVDCGPDHSVPMVPITEDQFEAICSCLSWGFFEAQAALAFLSVSEPPAKTDGSVQVSPSERKVTMLLKPSALFASLGYSDPFLLEFAREGPGNLDIILQAVISVVDEVVEGQQSLYKNRDTGHFLTTASFLFESLGDSRAIPVLKKIFRFANSGSKKFGSFSNYRSAKEISLMVLKKFGFRGSEEDLLKGTTKPGENAPDHIEKMLGREDQKSIYRLLLQHRDIKQLVLEGSELLELLPNPQAWITLNSPEIAREAVRLAVQKLGSKINKLDHVLSQSLGVRAKNLKSTHFTFYADEVLDAVLQVSQMAQLRDDPELSAVLAQARYSNGVKLRFARREKSDLSLGDKCGDCTAKGSVNFGNSITWFINPAYNILKMSSGKHFIGKMNIALGRIAGEEAVIIDALEFNPQAAEGGPLHDKALECFDEAVSFLRQLAEGQNRSLFALTFSNSSGAQTLLENKGSRPVSVKGEGIRFMSQEEATEENVSLDDEAFDLMNKGMTIQLLIPTEDIARIMNSAGCSESPKLFYQMIRMTDLVETVPAEVKGGKNRIDEKLPLLEREVLNPAQIENPQIAKATSERNFEEAARLIFADEKWLGKIRGVFNLSASMRISPTFLARKMEKIYAAVAEDMDSLRSTISVDIETFVKL